jgi:hypothetical protein
MSNKLSSQFNSSIGKETFYGCASLRKIDFSGNTNVTSIGVGAFQGCEGLTEIRLPEGIFVGDALNSDVSIDDVAFADCKNLRNIYFPEVSGNLNAPKFYDGDQNYIFQNCPYVGIFFTYGTNEQTTAVNAFKSYNNNQLTKWAQDFYGV